MNSRSLTRRVALVFSGIALVSWSVPRAPGALFKLNSNIVAAAFFVGSSGTASATVSKADWALEHRPISFVENRGQVDSRATFYVEGTGTRLYFTSDGVMFTVPKKGDGILESARSRWTAKMTFVGARRGVKPVGESETPTVVSYFKGPKKEWKTGLRTYSRIIYKELWPGIDLVYTGAENKLKYEFDVKPGADPSLIKLKYDGASVSLDRSGALRIETPLGSLKDDKPYSYQEQAGGRTEVATAYCLLAQGDSGTRTCGFSVGAYDRSKVLYIDPAMTAYSGYIGGDLIDTAFGIAVDSTGAAYVAGYTESNTTDEFPLTVGPGLSWNFNKQFLFWSAFVAKVKPDGSALEYCGYIDGAGHQLASSIAIDSAGAAYVTGFTTSDQNSFPVSVGPSLTYSGGSQAVNDFLGDAFVAKVKPDGTGLDYCGYIGGQGEDAGYGIAVDSSGNAYVTGETNSPGPGQVSGSKIPFPAKVGPSLTNSGASTFKIPDAFIAKVKADGSGLVYAGFIGGTGLDQGVGVAVDSSGAAYVTGDTNSAPAGFSQLTVGPSLTESGGLDAFVAKVKPDGSGLNYCGYIGGTASDEGLGIAVDGSGNAYVTGETSSDQSSFPVKVGPKLTYSGTDGVMGDAFVAKVNSTGSGLVYCGYIGGSGGEAGYRIAVDSQGSAYITGSTNSTQATFPVTAATGRAATYSGGTVFGDAFLAKVDPSGASLLYAGYLGGLEDDSGIGVAVDSSGNAYVSGATLSSQSTFPVATGPFLFYKPGIFSEADAFVAKFTGLPGPAAGFTLSFAEPTITTPKMHKVTATINITRSGTFSGPVTISPPAAPPAGVVVKLQQTTVSGNSISFKIKVKGKAQSGTDQLVFTGKDSSGNLTQSTKLALVVQ